MTNTVHHNSLLNFEKINHLVMKLFIFLFSLNVGLVFNLKNMYTLVYEIFSVEVNHAKVLKNFPLSVCFSFHNANIGQIVKN